MPKQAGLTERGSSGDLSRGCLIVVGVLLLFAIMKNACDGKPSTVWDSSGNYSYCIARESWGTYSSEDLDKMIEYSVNNELPALANMNLSGRTIHLLPPTKVILVNAGLARSQIRIPNSERVIWVVSEAVGDCN